MNKRAKSNSIRIIGGQWRGRRLPVLDSDGLRPTTDRVRETLFNWLMHETRDAICLDAFAGSGAFGLECLSRGAQFVQFVESESAVASALKSNFTTLELAPERAGLADMSVIDFLSKPASKKFDLVFLDPPFKSSVLPKVVSLILENGWLSEDALIYIEQSSIGPEFVAPQTLQVYREGTAGQSLYRLYSTTKV